MIDQIRTPLGVVLIAAILTGCATLTQEDRDDFAEREIFAEAMTVGGVIGAVGGGVAGHAVACRNNNDAKCALGTAAGAAVGAGVGMAVGSLVAIYQVSNLHDYQMDNQHFEALLQTAQQRNQEIAQYNQKLESEITGLKKQKKEIRGQIASAKLKEVELKRKRVQKMIAERQDLANKLVASQRTQYEQQLARMKREEGRLDQFHKQLLEMESAVVGGANTAAAPRT